MSDPNPEYNSVWMGTSDTEDADGYFPVLGAVETLATATFAAKNTIGDYTKDAEDYLSTLILSDLSGGMNVEDMNEGSDTARAWTIFADTRRPGKISLNPLVESLTAPAAAPTGPAYSCGQIVNTPYFLIGAAASMKAYGRKESDGTWYAGVAVSPVIVPTGKPVAFANRLFVPCGASGYLIISEADSVGNPGVPTVTNVTTGGIAYPAAYDPASLNPNPPLAAAFAVFDQKLWALSTGGALCWSFTGSDDTWVWPYDEARAWYPRIQAGEAPKRIIGFYNPNGEPAIYVLSDRGGYIYSQATPPSIVNTPLVFPPHPDNGRACAIWRAGEDLQVGMGLDTWRYTSANVVVPLSGLARDDGVPQEMFGSVYDLEPETSELYCLVGPVTNGSSGYAYSTKVGAAGTGDGQFDDVRGLSVDSSGNVFAGDENNERIQKFTSALVYSSKYGSVGTGNGQFSSNNGPYGIAHDGSDNAFVVDRGNSRVQKFNSAGTYQSQFGTFDDGTPAVGGSDIWTLQNTYGSLGTLDDNFNTPGQVAVDEANDRIYIADTFNNRLIVRTLSTGAYSARITGLTTPLGVCVDSSGNVYVTYNTTSVRKYSSALALQWTISPVASQFTHITTDGTRLYVTDTGLQKVYKRLCSTGAAVTTFGSAGTGNGQFGASPMGIVTNGTHVWVADSGNSRIQQFTITGTYVAQFAVAGGYALHGLTLDSNGYLVLAAYGGDVVRRYTTAGTLLDSFAATNPTGVGAATGDVIWVSDYDNDTLVKWELVNVPAVAAIPPATSTFNLPQAIAIKASSGRIYVADTANHRIQYFTSAGAYGGQFGSSAYSAVTGAITAGSGDGELSSPSALAINQSSGDVYVLDTGNNRVAQFTATGTFIRNFGTTGTGDAQFTAPTAIAVHPTTFQVYVADATRDDIQIFNSSGTFVLKFGTSGTGNGQYSAISGMAFSATGTSLYIADLTDERIQRLLFSSATSGQTYPWLAAWTGIGWYGKKKFDLIGVAPNWMHVVATTNAYSLYLGMGDGSCYRMALHRYFENPRRALLALESDFEASGEIITPRFDAAMLGFWKLASHIVVFMDNATSTEYLTIEYQTDEITTWQSLGTVNSKAKTYLPFGLVSGAFSEGVPFNWIQFRLRLVRGSDTALTPIIKSMVLAYLKIPQNAHAFSFLVPFPKEEFMNRTGGEIRTALNALITSRKYFTLRFPDQDGQEQSYRGYLTAISGDDAPAQHQDGQRAVNFIQIADGEVA